MAQPPHIMEGVGSDGKKHTVYEFKQSIDLKNETLLETYVKIYFEKQLEYGRAVQFFIPSVDFSLFALRVAPYDWVVLVWVGYVLQPNL